MTQSPSNVMIYIVGPPGVGKSTVGSLLAESLPAKLVTNHHWLNPLFALVPQDGSTPLPAGIWPLAGQVRSAVLETIATISPRSWNFIVTHAALGGAEDDEIAHDVLAAARRRRAHLLVVRLGCAPETLAARVLEPERRRLMKEADAAAARRNALRPHFDPGHPHTVTIDTTELTAAQVAGRIAAALS